MLRKRFGILAMFITAVVAFGLGNYLASDASSDDPQGGSSPWCIKSELPSVPNGTDMEISGHRTDCDTLTKDSVVYLYLHRKNYPKTRSTLIFRYDGNDPKICWIDDDHISIEADGVSSVDKQISLLNDISISYNLMMPYKSQLEQIPYDPVRSREIFRDIIRRVNKTMR